MIVQMHLVVQKFTNECRSNTPVETSMKEESRLQQL